MKKKSSRIVALVLTLCMVFFGLPVTAMAEEKVAEIEGGSSYTTLSDAITNAEDGQTVRLLTDTSLSSYIRIQESIKLDINGNTITSDGLAFAVSDNATFTITDSSKSKDGEIKSTETDNCNLLEVSSGEIIVENGKLSNNWYVIYVSQTGKATIKGGTLTSSVASVLSTNGSPIGNVNYSAKAVMNVEGGTLVSTNDVTIYLPAGTLNITGGEIVGATAVYSKCGVTNISGNPVIKSESDYREFDHSNNGCNATGDAMVVEACNYPNGNPEVYISGGTFTSKNGASVAYYEYDGNHAKEFSITGGTFSSDVSSFVPSGYECNQSGNKWVVGLPDDTMIVTPETSEDGSASATLDGAYVGNNTSIATGGTDEGDTSASGNVTDTGSVEINLSTASQTTSATLTVTDVAAASLSSAPSLTVKTDAGDVTLQEDALQKVAEAGENGDNVTVTVTKENTPTGADAKAAYTVTVEADGENLLPASASDNGEITITVEKPEGESAIQAWYAVKNASGTWLPVEELESKEVDGKLAITITHLSTVILYGAEQSSSTVATVKNGDKETAHSDFKDALDAANLAGDGSVITLWKDVPVTTNSALNIQKDITITSANGDQKTITLTMDDSVTDDRTKLIKMTDNLTLDNVALTLKPSATSGKGDGIQMGDGGSDLVTLTLKNGAKLKFANNDDEESVKNAFVMPAGAGANVIVDNSEISAEGVDGNFSNGGIFTIQNRSTVTINDCEDYGLSVNGLTVDDSTLTITGTKLSAIRTAGADSVVSVVNDGEIIVERCGESLPNDESEWSYAKGVIDLGHLKDEKTRVPAILNVDNDSSITLRENVNSDNEKIDYVYLTNSVSNLNRGSVTGIVQEDGLPDDYCKVTYTVNNEIDVEIRAKISDENKITFTEPAAPVVSGYRFVRWNYPVAVDKDADGTISMTVEKGTTYTVNAELTMRSSTSDDAPSLGYRLPYIGESTGGKNFVSDTTGNLTVNGKYQFRITSTDGHKPVMTVSNSNFTVELASRSGNDYFYVIRCAGAAGSTANVLVDGIHVVVATVGTAGVVSDTTHPFTVAQGAAYQFKLTSASRPTFTGNNANFTIAYVSNSGNDWFFKVTAAGAAGASTTFSANGVVVTTATIA